MALACGNALFALSQTLTWIPFYLQKRYNIESHKSTVNIGDVVREKFRREVYRCLKTI
jgi:hypothetical protein